MAEKGNKSVNCQQYAFPPLYDSKPQAGKQKAGSADCQPTKVDLSEIERQAFEKSYAECFKDILEKRKNIVEKAAASVNLQRKDWNNLIERLERKISREIIHAGLDLAEILIKQKLRTDQYYIRNIVNNAMGHVVANGKVIIKTNPEDWQIIKEIIDNREIETPNSDLVQVESDSGIEKGGCIIESDYGTIDARISSQLEVIRKALED